MLTTTHVCTIDDAAGDGWVDIVATVDSTLAIQRVTLTGSTENVRDELTVAQIAQVRAAIDQVETQLLRQLREAGAEVRAAEYWEGRAA